MAKKFKYIGMENEPPQPPSEKQPEAKIFEFPKKDKSALEDARERHPSRRGTETPAQTLARLGLENTPDDPDTA